LEKGTHATPEQADVQAQRHIGAVYPLLAADTCHIPVGVRHVESDGFGVKGFA